MGLGDQSGGGAGGPAAAAASLSLVALLGVLC